MFWFLFWWLEILLMWFYWLFGWFVLCVLKVVYNWICVCVSFVFCLYKVFVFVYWVCDRCLVSYLVFLDNFEYGYGWLKSLVKFGGFWLWINEIWFFVFCCNDYIGLIRENMFMIFVDKFGYNFFWLSDFFCFYVGLMNCLKNRCYFNLLNLNKIFFFFWRLFVLEF